MRRFTNSSNVPLSMAVFLATDNYDHDPNTISATALLKPIKQIILAGRVPANESLNDVMSMVPSRMGSAIHDSIERSWTENHKEALESLGYPKKVIERVLVNPSEDQLFDGCIPVYLEQRAYRDIDGYRVSGKYDFVGDGRVEDFKSTSVNSWIMQSNADKYILQGSIYRWLNPKLITKDEMAIQYIFTDWSAMQARTNPKYPPQRTMQQLYPLKSIGETEHFVRAKLRQITQLKDAPEEEIPPCSDEDLWRRDPQFKYYKNPKATGRSTKNFDNKQDAYIRMAQDGNVGRVDVVPGKAVACKYCPAFPVCKQAQALIAAGDLDM